MSPSTAHESVLLWLRDDPSQLRTLLEIAGHEPRSTPLSVADSALRAAFPVEVTPDLVLLEATSEGGWRWMVVEVQRQRDEAKARRWPLAMAAMADRYGADGEFVVITASRAVARWAERVSMHQVGKTRWGVMPTVLRLGPVEAEAILARAPPEMAVFAAWVMQGRHGDRAVDLARRALVRGATVTDDRLRRATQEGILAVLHPAVMEQVRSALMIDINQLPRNPALEQWKADLRVEGEARLLVRILRGRGLDVSAEIEARIMAATSTEVVERWADRALSASSIEAVFAED